MSRCSVAVRRGTVGHASARSNNEGGFSGICPTNSDVRPDVLVAPAAAGQWGVLSLDELFACGLSRGTAIGTGYATAACTCIHRGVYAVGHANLSLEGRFLAAVKACGAAARC